mgnify:CR=1 FL=1
MEERVKDQQMIFKWAMNYVLIGMKQLFELDTMEEKIDMIQTHIKSVV